MSLLDRLQGLSRDSFLSRSKTYPELVTKSLLSELRKMAKSANPTALDVNLEVHQKMLGERLSPFANTGFEFAETRLYQTGDNVRFINWRRYAKSGELYINTFHEERRPQCWLVMDRRANMRFGTRVRLKATQAAIYTLFHLFKAQHQQMDIGGIILDHGLHWYDAKSSTASVQPLIQHITAPCPPLADKTDDQFSQALRLLNVRLQLGCLIIFISDFSDLNDSDSSNLNALANQHSLAAVQIVDPIEAQLPNQGRYNVLQPQDQSIISLDCNNPGQQQQLNQQLQTQLRDVEQQLTQCRVQFKQVFSNANFQEKSELVS